MIKFRLNLIHKFELVHTCELNPRYDSAVLILFEWLIRALAWHLEPVRGQRPKHESVVVVSGVFCPKDIEEKPALVSEVIDYSA